MQQMPPIKNTAGEGFIVEDDVVAWLACHMLAGIPWPTAQGDELRALHCQMRQDGWHYFDDVVAKISRNRSDFRVECSIKSFPVFGQEGAPVNFAIALWKEWRNKDLPFHQGRDQLALFAARHTHCISETWKSLLDAARSMKADTLAQRITSGTEPSQSKCAAFESIRRQHSPDAQTPADSEETARLLASFILGRDLNWKLITLENRRRASRMKRYGLRDDQWEPIKDLLPGRAGHVGVTARNNRRFVEAVLYRYRAGIPWRDLAQQLGHWKRFIRDLAVGLNEVSGKGYSRL